MPLVLELTYLESDSCCPGKTDGDFLLLPLAVLQHMACFQHDLQEAAEVISAGKVKEAQAKELFDKVDADKSGVIEYGEFKKVLGNIPRHRTKFWAKMVLDLPATPHGFCTTWFASCP